MKYIIPVLLVCGAAALSRAQEFNEYNYPTRRAIIANVCPSVKLTKFEFGNTRSDSTDRFSQKFGWTNIGAREIIAVEFVTLKYDPFNLPLIGSRSTFPGHNSANYTVLKAGESDNDGGSSYGSEETFTAICYVRAVRFTDGTVWTAAPVDIIKSIKTQVPDILDPGPLAPEKKKEKQPGQ